MLKIESVNIFVSENAAVIELESGKKYKILIKDYENLLPEDINADNLRFLSRKYNIYNSALSKVAFTDMSKRTLYQKLYYAVLQNQRKPVGRGFPDAPQSQNDAPQGEPNPGGNSRRVREAAPYNDVPQIEPEELKELCRLVCDEFEDAGYINDKKYALDKAKYLKEYKKYGKNRIKDYLYQKGVPKQEIDEALEDEYFDDEDGDYENMLGLLKRKYRSGIDKSDRNAVSKAINLLARNGYNYTQAKKAVTEFIENQEM